jgi:hypothetical protein
MSVSFQDLQEALTLDDKDEFIVWQNSSKKNKRVKRGNFFNSRGISVRGRFIDSATGNDVGLASATAVLNAALAQASANGAQASANGKNRIYYSPSEPAIGVVTGSISGTTLTVTAVSTPVITGGSTYIYIGAILSGGSIISGTKVTGYGTGSGGVGTYSISTSQTVGSGSINANPFTVGDVWYNTTDSLYKQYVCTAVTNTTKTFSDSFAPLFRLDENNNITGLQKVGMTDKNFVLVADNFAITNGSNQVSEADRYPFQVVTVNGSQKVFIKEANIQFLDAGKLTAGFIGAQTIELNNSAAYIQSSQYIPTWVSGQFIVREFNSGETFFGKSVPSDVVRVKVLQSNGTYKIFNSRTLQNGGLTNATQGPPLSGQDTYWIEVVPSTANGLKQTVDLGDGVSREIDNFGFRIVGQGTAEFAGGLFRGAVVATEGYFGSASNAVLIDSTGLQIGALGRIKSSSMIWTDSGGTGSFSTTGSTGGFYLGYTAGSANAYQFYIGSTSRFLRWDGANLRINGNLVNGTTIGGASGSEGLLRGVDDAVLTINGGSANGIQYGAQIDLVGADYTGIADAQGWLILQAGWKTGFSGGDGSLVFKTSKGSVVDSKDVGIDRLTIEADGTVTVVGGISSIGGAPNGGAGKLVVDTSITAPTYTSTSSKRFKKKIKNLKNGLEIVSKLRPVVFDWKTKDLKNDIGLIAEEVNEIIPNLVGLDNKGQITGIDYGKLTPILIQAVKDLSIEIQKLKKKIN